MRSLQGYKRAADVYIAIKQQDNAIKLLKAGVAAIRGADGNVSTAHYPQAKYLTG